VARSVGGCLLSDSTLLMNNSVNGAEHFLLSVGSDVFSTPLGPALFHAVRNLSTFRGLFTRRAVAFGKSEWLVLHHQTSKPDRSIELFDIAVQLPAVLEKADGIITAWHAYDPSLTQRIIGLGQALRVWHAKWYPHGGKVPCRIIDLEDARAFFESMPYRTFPTIFDYDSTQRYHEMQVYWFSCAALDGVLLDILSFEEDKGVIRLGPVGRGGVPGRDDLLDDIHHSATSICRGIPYCWSPELIASRRMTKLMLLMAESLFERTGHCREIDWCRSAQQTLDARLRKAQS
jgi:hypothetical protein